jgi:voltage-gated potassium channel
MFVLAIAFAAVVVIEATCDLTRAQERVLELAQWGIWLAFLAEYVALLMLAPDRWGYVRSHWLDLVIIAVPMLRIFRIARALRALRVLRAGAMFTKGAEALRVIMGRRGVLLVMVLGALLVFAGAGVAFIAEEGAGSGFDTYGASLWWAVVTFTTVGYGDMSPVTVTGRIAAVVLMLLGIGLYGTITASVAAYFVEEDEGEAERLARIEGKIDKLAGAIERLESRDAGP